MTFEYGPYLRECFSQPVLSLLWTLPFILAFLLILTSLRGTHDPAARRRRAGSLIGALCLLVVIAFPLHKQLRVLVRTNGVAIWQDRNAAPLTCTGVIEAIELPERNAVTRYVHEGKNVYGAWLTIGGETYYAMTEGGFVPGDAVVIEYLPKSRCVLSLASADSTTAEE